MCTCMYVYVRIYINCMRSLFRMETSVSLVMVIVHLHLITFALEGNNCLHSNCGSRKCLLLVLLTWIKGCVSATETDKLVQC